MIDQCMLDAVIITTPIFNHVEAAEYAIGKGICALFIEKSMTKNYEEAKKLADLISFNNIISNVGFHYRFIPSIKKGKELVIENAIGKIRNVKAYLYSSDILTESM